MGKIIEFGTNWIGENSSIIPSLLTTNELVLARNLKLDSFGNLVSRGGLEKVTISGTEEASAIKFMAYIPVGSNHYLFVVDANHKIYKCTGTEPNLNLGNSISTLAGEATLTAFNNACIIMDGSYLKQTQGTTVDLCYDDGEGIGGFNYSNMCYPSDVATKLYSGSTTRCGSKFTTPDWGNGTIPITRLDIYVSKTGTITGIVEAQLYNSTGDTLLVTSSTAFNNSQLTSNPMKLRFNFFNDSYKMSSNTSYIIGVTYSGGDSSNYINIYSHTVVSGSGDNYYYDNSWHADTTKNTSLGIKPGIPPKAKFGDVNSTRLFLGGDPDHVGYLWYSNINTPYDWSTGAIVDPITNSYTQEGAGYVSSVDDNANSYPIGAIIPFFGELYIFGTEAQPYLSKLTGTSPDNYSLPVLYQKVDTSYKTCIGLLNDIWFCSKNNVHNLKGVQEFGDLRTFGPGDPIKQYIKNYYNKDTTFAGYNPSDGQYFLKFADCDDIFVCHTLDPFMRKQGDTHSSYVWTRYSANGIIPTSFVNFNGNCYIGAKDGNIYKLNENLHQDNGNDLVIELKTGIKNFPFGSTDLKQCYFEIVSNTNVAGTCSYYKNGSDSSYWDEDITITNIPFQKEINLTQNNLQLYFHDFGRLNDKLYFKRLLFVSGKMRSR